MPYDFTDAVKGLAKGEREALLAALEYLEANGGGGSPVVRKFPFAFDTPDLLTGAPLYVPTIGDILLDGWIEINVPWVTATTALGDFGPNISQGGGLLNNGWSTAVDMTLADEQFPSDGALTPGLLWPTSSLSSLAQLSAAEAANALLQIPAIDSTPAPQQGLVPVNERPARFLRFSGLKIIAADPFMVMVNQTGGGGGGDPGSTQGEAVLYLVTATPV